MGRFLRSARRTARPGPTVTEPAHQSFRGSPGVADKELNRTEGGEQLFCEGCDEPALTSLGLSRTRELMFPVPPFSMPSEQRDAPVLPTERRLPIASQHNEIVCEITKSRQETVTRQPCLCLFIAP